MKEKLKLEASVRKQAIEEIKQYFDDERDEQLGDLAAGLILDFMVKTIGPSIYNKAIEDARYMMSEKLDELFSLEM